MNENITSTTSIQGMTQAIVANSGIPAFMLFTIGLAGVLGMVSMFRLPKNFYPFMILLYSLFGVEIGLVPIWMMIFSFFFFSIYLISWLRTAFVGYAETTTSDFIQKVIESKPIEEPKTVNCRNCGGPNVERVTCEWCGQVL